MQLYLHCLGRKCTYKATRTFFQVFRDTVASGLSVVKCNNRIEYARTPNHRAVDVVFRKQTAYFRYVTSDYSIPRTYSDVVLAIHTVYAVFENDSRLKKKKLDLKYDLKCEQIVCRHRTG